MKKKWVSSKWVWIVDQSMEVQVVLLTWFLQILDKMHRINVLAIFLWDEGMTI